MTLALAMGMTLRELLIRMDSRELAEWEAWVGLEGPIGEERADLRAGIITANLLNAWRSRRDRALAPIDFMPFAKRRRQRQTPDELRATVKRMHDALAASF